MFLPIQPASAPPSASVYPIYQSSSNPPAPMSTVFGFGESVLRTRHQPVERGVGAELLCLLATGGLTWMADE